MTAVMLSATDPVIETDVASYGLLLAAHRPSGPDSTYTRVNHWLAPWYTVVPAENPEGILGVHAWVPVDDRSCLIFGLMWHPATDLTDQQRAEMQSGRRGIFPELLADGSYRAQRHAGNDYLIDRQAQAEGALWTGVLGNQEQDDAITASMGAAYDRTREVLCATDRAVIAVRSALLGVAVDHAAGREPIGLSGRGYDVPSVFYEVPGGTNFRDRLAELMAPKQVILAGAGG